MRIPTSDGAGQRGTRRHGRGAPDPGSDRDTTGPDAGQDTGSRDTSRRHAAGNHAGSSGAASSGLGPPGAGTRTSPAQYAAGPASSGTSAGDASSVFAPGYDSSRAGDQAASARPGTRGSSSWYGSTAGGAAGKGPVRGYPPSPGQPPPVYPPGQFAAWNVGQGSRSRSAQPGPQDRGGFPGRPRPDASQPDASQPDTGQPDQAGRQPGDSRSSDSSIAEPGYSVLAVSDPAADVTSTQTWKAVGDGRSTGSWTAPASRPGAGPGSQPGSPRASSGRHSAPPGAATLDRAGRGLADPNLATEGLAREAVASPGLPAPDVATPDVAGPEPRADRAAPDGQRRDRAHSGAHSGPHAAVRTERAPQAEPGQGRAKSPAGRKRPSDRKRTAGRKRPASVKLAISVALLLVSCAAATLGYTVLHTSATPKPASASGRSAQPKATPSASQSPSLGPYGHIASRQSDPEALTIAQLFPASFTISGQPVTRAARAISRHCAAAVSGTHLQSVISSAHCDQAVRATYLSRAKGLMGTIGVLNLSTAARAVKAVNAADASDFINQLKGKRGPTSKIGNGTGIEEALAKGHYLILIWAEFTNLHKPRKATQRSEVETFMTELLQNTANVSLATRMLTGSP